MQSEIFFKEYNSIPFNDKEILRYAGQKTEISDFEDLLCDYKQKAKDVIKAKLCWRKIERKEIDPFVSNVKGTAFEKYFDDCKNGILFASTLGLDFDRLIKKTEVQSMLAALMLQAIGAQQIEAVCDMFCNEIREKYPGAKPRFSPGYEGLELDAQKKVFKLLDCERKIGLTLNESLMMSPTKSVTAFIAIKNE